MLNRGIRRVGGRLARQRCIGLFLICCTLVSSTGHVLLAMCLTKPHRMLCVSQPDETNDDDEQEVAIVASEAEENEKNEESVVKHTVTPQTMTSHCACGFRQTAHATIRVVTADSPIRTFDKLVI
jgi:hypothetical protein